MEFIWHSSNQRWTQCFIYISVQKIEARCYWEVSFFANNVKQWIFFDKGFLFISKSHGHGVYFESHSLILILILFMWCVHKIKPNRRIGADLVNNVKRWIFLFLLIYDRIAQTCCLSDLLSLHCSWNLGSLSRFTIHSIVKIYSSSVKPESVTT